MTALSSTGPGLLNKSSASVTGSSVEVKSGVPSETVSTVGLSSRESLPADDLMTRNDQTIKNRDVNGEQQTHVVEPC